MIRVLFVCLGNICRSPAAEGVMRHLVREARLDDVIEIDSAGTGDWHVGELPDPRMRKHARVRGYDLSSRARQIKVEDFRKFDHILVMDPSNLRNVRALEPKDARARVRELARLCRKVAAREVPDPYYGGPEGFEKVLDILEDACEALLEELKAELASRG